MILKNIYNQKATLFNKLKRSDSGTNNDIWYKTVLNNIAWYRKVERGIINNGVIMDSYIEILIPFHDEFLPYIEWKNTGNQSENFTISIGDYIVLGEIDEYFDNSNIVKGLQEYGENVCLVKHFEITHNRFGANVQLKIQGV